MIVDAQFVTIATVLAAFLVKMGGAWMWRNWQPSKPATPHATAPHATGEETAP